MSFWGFLGASYISKNVPVNWDKKYKWVNFIPLLYGEKRPDWTWFLSKGYFFYHDVLITGVEKKRESFKKNIEDQKVKILVLTIATQNLCAFMSTIEINIIIFKYILKQNRMLQNLLVLFRSTRSTLVKSYCYTKSIKITNIIVVYLAILLILVELIK